MQPAQPQSARPARYGLLFVGILLIAVNLRASITSVGPVLSIIRADLGLSAATVSVLISIPLVAFACFSPVAPWLARTIGMERALGTALIVLALGIVTRSVPWVPGLWIGTFLLGVAIAILNVVLPALIKRDYPGQVGRITGIYSSVQSAGAAFASGFAVPLAGTAPHGWRISLGIWAGLALIAFAVFLPQLRHKTMPPAAAGRAAASPHGSDAGVVTYRSPWRSALGWQITVYMSAQSTVYYALLTWWPTIDQANGFTAVEAGWHQFFFQLVSIVGNLATAVLIHRWRDQRPIAAGAGVLLLLALTGELLAPTLSLLWLLGLGVGVGSSIVLALSLFGLRTEHHLQAARVSGMAQSVGYLVASTGPVLIGLLHEASGSWTWPLLVLIGLLGVQLTAGVLAGRDRSIGALGSSLRSSSAATSADATAGS